MKVKTFVGSAWGDYTENLVNEFMVDKIVLDVKVEYFIRNKIPSTNNEQHEFVSYTVLYEDKQEPDLVKKHKPPKDNNTDMREALRVIDIENHRVRRVSELSLLKDSGTITKAQEKELSNISKELGVSNTNISQNSLQ